MAKGKLDQMKSLKIVFFYLIVYVTGQSKDGLALFSVLESSTGQSQCQPELQKCQGLGQGQ